MLEQPWLSLDPEAPVPLYHQIAVALRYRIATGELAPGDRLPALRDAARSWDVNYHTVRRAYEVLKGSGLVAMRRGAGSTVTSAAPDEPAAGDGGLDRFLESVRAEARTRFGVSPRELSRMIEAADGTPGRRADGADPPSRPSCTVVECNAHQCADLAGQIRRRYGVDVCEWILGAEGEPPPGPLVGTYFHFAEMRSRWPKRRSEMHFPAVRPDPSVRDRIASGGDPAAAGPIPLVEREGSLAGAMAEDVGHLAGSREIAPTTEPEHIRQLIRGGPVLVAPRIWNDLPPDLREDPAVIELRYVWRDHDLDALASTLGWVAPTSNSD